MWDTVIAMMSGVKLVTLYLCLQNQVLLPLVAHKHHNLSNSHYKELHIKIKQLLTCGRKQSPSVKINMGFDYLLFVGGLQVAGVTTRSAHGSTKYRIRAYSDLNFLLGKTGIIEVSTTMVTMPMLI